MKEISAAELQREIADLERQLSASGERFADEVDRSERTARRSRQADDLDCPECEEFADLTLLDAGAEDEIDQDGLSALEDLQGKAGLADADRVVSVASRTERLAEAVERLDKLAAYCEKEGARKLAFRIDQLTEQVEAELKTAKAEEAKA